MVCAITRSGGQQSSLYYFMQSKRVCLTASSCGLFCVPHSEYSSYTIFWLLFWVPHSEYSSHTIFWRNVLCTIHEFSTYTVCGVLFYVPYMNSVCTLFVAFCFMCHTWIQYVHCLWRSEYDTWMWRSVFVVVLFCLFFSFLLFVPCFEYNFRAGELRVKTVLSTSSVCSRVCFRDIRQWFSELQQMTPSRSLTYHSL